MSSPARLQDVDYPDSDGKPMAESDLHRRWMVRIIDLLQHRYRGRRVYVSGNLLVYYVEGDPKKSVSPDALVVKDCDPGLRRTYKLWEEGRPPDVVFETTSSSTRHKDEHDKPNIYRQLGVKEYFLYDPTSDYLRPPLQGYRLEEGGYARLEPEAGGGLESRELGLLLRLDDGELAMFDARTGARLLTQAEAAEAAREAAEAKAQQVEQAREAEHAARLTAEAELQRLRRQLGKDEEAAGS